MWTLAKDVGSLVGLCVGLLTTVYYAVPPFRKLVDTWIERRVGARFDKELEEHRHRLRLDAEAVRADYQRRLHDFSLFSAKMHEIYAEGFRLILIAEGALLQLSSSRIMQSYDEYSSDEMKTVMKDAGFTERQTAAVAGDWDTDRVAAMRAFNSAMRNVEMARARRAINEANNYTLVNSLYLREARWKMVADILKAFEGLFIGEMYSDPTNAGEQRKLRLDASGLVERLKRALREDLESGAGVSTRLPETGSPEIGSG